MILIVLGLEELLFPLNTEYEIERVIKRQGQCLSDRFELISLSNIGMIHSCKKKL